MKMKYIGKLISVVLFLGLFVSCSDKYFGIGIPGNHYDPMPMRDNMIVYTTTDGNPLEFSPWQMDRLGFENSASSKGGILTFHQNLIYLSDELFSGQLRLQSVKLPNGIVEIGNNCFRGCENLESIKFPEKLCLINSGAFMSCTKLQNVFFPANLQVIGTPDSYSEYGAFQNCVNLLNVEFNNALTRIGVDSFYGCTSLKEIVLPESVKNIASRAFYSCTDLREVRCLGTVPPVLGYNVFEGNHTSRKFLVPYSSISIYMNDNGWYEYSGYIFPYSPQL